jgi:serine/threonine-protein kinase HipA
MDKKQLSVRLHGEPVGVLEQTITGKMVFSYLNSATRAISLSMPIREQPYDNIQCEAFFGGLLPESAAVRQIIGKRYGISAHNSFALLKAIGYDCAGAISFYTMDEPIVPQHTFPLQGNIISEDELYIHIKELPQKPFFLDVEDLRLSLAGVQDKAAVCVIDEQIALPEHGCPTTHILKPAASGLEGIVENEYFCLELARYVGLNIPNVEIRCIKDISFLLIERYDRKIQNKQITRIHQEDFCQASGIVSAKKYQNEGGPGFKECFALLNNVTRPAANRNMLAWAVVFNFLICNMDAHSKNFSLLHEDAAQIRLAPFYDLLCTRVYPTLTTKMAMKIGNKYAINDVFPRHWQQLCLDIDYAYPAMQQLIQTEGEILLQTMEQSRKYFIEKIKNPIIINKIIELLKRHIAETLQQFVSSP